jgi:hypothetical protein
LPLEQVAEIIRTDEIVSVCGIGFVPIVLFGDDCDPGVPGVPVAPDVRPVVPVAPVVPDAPPAPAVLAPVEPVVPVDGDPAAELPGIVLDMLPAESLNMPVMATLWLTC